MQRTTTEINPRKGFNMVTRLTIEGTPADPAQTVLNGAQIDGLLTGNTAYLELPSGIASLLYGADGVAVVKFPSGATKKGPWTILADHYCVDWETGPANSCSRVVKTAGAITIVYLVTPHAPPPANNLAPLTPSLLH